MVATRYEPSLKYLMLVLDCDAETLAALPAPDRAQLLVAVRAEDHTLVGVIVTAQGDSSSHFVSRFFAPWAGIDEDPVTGSAHSVLGPFWAARLAVNSMRAEQLSARRGLLGVEVLQDAVVLTGRAVVVLQGVLLL